MILLAASAASLTSCETTSLGAALGTQKQAALIDKAIAAGQIPPYPAACRELVRTGVLAGDRLDVALLKADRALGRANAKIKACAEWYDGISGAHK